MKPQSLLHLRGVPLHPAPIDVGKPTLAGERPDGAWISVIVNVRAQTNERGEITGAINCFVDVTERKRADEELRRLNADLKQFSYAACHDLQEPLRIVMSYTQLLAREYKGRLDRRADQFIATAVDGMNRESKTSFRSTVTAFWRRCSPTWKYRSAKAERLSPTISCPR